MIKFVFLFQDLLAAIKMLGLNPIVDLTNQIPKNGLIGYPERCHSQIGLYWFTVFVVVFHFKLFRLSSIMIFLLLSF